MENWKVAGILLLISAMTGFYESTVLLKGGGAIAVLNDSLGGTLTVCGGLLLIFAVLTLLGAIMALQGRNWALALMGAIFGLLTIGPFFLGSIFGLIALILIAMSKDKFDSKQPSPQVDNPPPGYPAPQDLKAPPPDSALPPSPPPSSYSLDPSPSSPPPPPPSPPPTPSSPPPPPPSPLPLPSSEEMSFFTNPENEPHVHLLVLLIITFVLGAILMTY